MRHQLIAALLRRGVREFMPCCVSYECPRNGFMLQEQYKASLKRVKLHQGGTRLQFSK